MTRKEIDAMSDADVELLQSKHVVEQVETARDEAIARIEARDAEHADLLKGHQDTIKAKDDAHAAELEKLRAEHAKALDDLQASHMDEMYALSAKLAANESKLAAMQVYVEACGGSEYAKEQALIAKKEALAKEMQDADAKKAEAEAEKQRAAEELAKLDEAAKKPANLE